MRRVTLAVLLPLALTGALASGAAGGSAPKPTPKRAFASHPLAFGSAPRGSFRVTLLINPALTVAPGADNVGASQFVTTDLAVGCQKLPNGGGVAIIGIPKLHFALRHGRYRISKTFTRHGVSPFGAAKALTLKVTLTAVAASTRKITGTLKITGSGCAVGKHAYTATILPKNVVSPSL